MPLFQQLIDRFSRGGSSQPFDDAAKRQDRLARVARVMHVEPIRPPVEAVLDALEEDCAEPLYDRSVYVSPPQGAAEA